VGCGYGSGNRRKDNPLVRIAPVHQRVGRQLIPGAERISDAEGAKRRADEPLRPRVGQKPADEGLFGDGATQTDLIDLARRPKPAKP
jgi:hypothetical protein